MMNKIYQRGADMKKKIIIVSAILVVLITLIAIPKSTYQKWFGKEPTSDLPTTSNEYQTVFVVGENNKLTGVKVVVEEIADDQILQKWELLTSKMNLIPSGYSSPITPSTVLNNYNIDNTTLVFDVSEDILRSSGRLAIESLAWTFCNDEIKEVKLVVDGEEIKTISDYNFSKISKEMGTNFTYETSYLFEADCTTIVYYEDELVIPVTYFYTDYTEYDFIISKIFTAEIVEVSDYSYEVTDETFVIKFNDTINLSDELKQTLNETVKFNMMVNSVSVNAVDDVLYEQTFIELN